MESTLLRQVMPMALRQIDTENERARTWDISDESIDRHETILPLEGWELDSFNKAGAFYYQHITDGGSWWDEQPNPDYALGPADAYIDQESKTLIGRGIFEPEDINELADTIMKKVDYGTMRMTSVGFIPLEAGSFGDETKGQNPEIYYFGKRELIEFSVVHIGSNRNALGRALEPMQKFLSSEVDRLDIIKGLKMDFRKKIGAMTMQFYDNQFKQNILL